MQAQASSRSLTTPARAHSSAAVRGAAGLLGDLQEYVEQLEETAKQQKRQIEQLRDDKRRAAEVRA